MASRYAEHGWGDADAARMIETASEGKQIDLLREIRTRLVAKLADPTVAARDLASLTSRVVDVSKEIQRGELAGEDTSIEDAIATPDEPFNPYTDL